MSMYVSSPLQNQILKANALGAQPKDKVIKTWSRRSTVIVQMLHLVIHVYNGKKFIPVNITEGMLGHKLGEFAATRYFKGHPVSKAKTDAKK